MNLKTILKFIPYICFKLLQKWHEEYRYEIYRNKYNIHPSFKFNGYNIKLYYDGKIILGANSYIGEGATIQSKPGCLVKVGQNCRISHNVRIYTGSKISDQDFSKTDKVQTGDVIIEDHVWIGANVFITPGIKIGENSIVGANSVVTHDIDPWTIVGGVPARFIRKKQITELNEECSNL